HGRLRRLVLDQHAGGAVAAAGVDQLDVRTAGLLEAAHVAAVAGVAAHAARLGAVEAGGDHGHAHVVLHVRVQHGADDDGGVLAGEVLHRAADLVELGHGEVRAGGDVDQDAVGAGQVDVVQ